MSNDKIKKLISFNENMDQMVKELMERGYSSYTAVIHDAIMSFHRKFFPKKIISKIKQHGN